MKLLFCGQRGVGKSTLIRRLLPPGVALYGFETFFAGERSGTSALYIRRPYDLQAPCGPQNRVGVRGAAPGTAAGFPGVFDAYGASLLQNIPAGSIVVMDELGYLEREAHAFLRQIRQILTGPYHVLAAIKTARQPHLQEIKTLPGIKTIQVTVENREGLYDSIRAWPQYSDMLLGQNMF